MNHLDLFSGIGGFALAVDRVWPGSTHIFCDNDLFCQEVLRKHWPDSKIYGDIKEFGEKVHPDLVTAGFPCQPASYAGKKRGTADTRWLWPETIRAIRETKPTWVILENVRGLISLDGGLVFQSLLLDMETNDYEVQAFIIPACAVNAPHRRDRVWVIAHSASDGLHEPKNRKGDNKRNDDNTERQDKLRQLKGSNTIRPQITNWGEDWLKIATKSNRMDDGLPNRLYRIKALGNSIVPQVAEEIMKAIKQTYV